jgi:hypothetical protein
MWTEALVFVYNQTCVENLCKLQVNKLSVHHEAVPAKIPTTFTRRDSGLLEQIVVYGVADRGQSSRPFRAKFDFPNGIYRINGVFRL